MERLIAKLMNSHNSRTTRFFAFMAILTGFFEYSQHVLPQIAAYVTDDIYQTLLVITIAGGVVCRFITSKDLLDR